MNERVQLLFTARPSRQSCYDSQQISGILFCTHSSLDGFQLQLSNTKQLEEWIYLSQIKTQNPHIKAVRLQLTSEEQHRYQIYDVQSASVRNSYDAVFVDDTLAVTVHVSPDFLQQTELREVGSVISVMTFLGIYQTSNPTVATEEIFENFNSKINSYYESDIIQLPLVIES